MYELRDREVGPIDYDVKLDLEKYEEMVIWKRFFITFSFIAHFRTNPYGHPIWNSVVSEIVRGIFLHMVCTEYIENRGLDEG